jgi:hypothetical protein
VYALATVLYEVASRTSPFEDEYDVSVVANHIKAGKRPKWPLCPALAIMEANSNSNSERAKAAACEVASFAQFKALAFKAWAQDPLERPSAAELADEMRSMRVDYLAQLQEVQQSRLLRLSAASTAGSKITKSAVLAATASPVRRKSQSQQQQQQQLPVDLSIPATEGSDL